MRTVEKFLLEYRWVFVCMFLLPLSFLFNLATILREKLIFMLHSDPKQHHLKVRRVQKQLLAYNVELAKCSSDTSQDRPILCTSRPGWQTMSFRFPKYKTNNKFQLDLSKLVDVIEFNGHDRFVVVEPMISMRQINGYLLNRGFTLPIVPELDDLTIGGLIMGTGIESSSFIYGLFDKICLQYEVLLPTGELVLCDPNQNADLFAAIPWSYGTLGFLMSVKLRIIEAKRYVRMEYECFDTVDSYCDRLNGLVSDESGTEFIEGIILSPQKLVIMTGRMVDEKRTGEHLNRIGKWYKPWFYKYVESVCFKVNSSLKSPRPDVIPLLDYYHRHSRSIFWEFEQIVPFGNNFLFRLIFGWMQPIKIGLLKLTQTQKTKELYEQNHLIQDLLLPIRNLKPTLEFFDKVCHIYPIWICPFKLNRHEEMGFLKANTDEAYQKNILDNYYVDIGLYGVPGVRHFDPVACTRQIEAKCRELDGFQMLYADSYMTREEFQQMFSHELYWTVRKKYGLNQLTPEVYDKVNRQARS